MGNTLTCPHCGADCTDTTSGPEANCPHCGRLLLERAITPEPDSTPLAAPSEGALKGRRPARAVQPRRNLDVKRPFPMGWVLAGLGALLLLLVAGAAGLGWLFWLRLTAPPPVAVVSAPLPAEVEERAGGIPQDFLLDPPGLDAQPRPPFKVDPLLEQAKDVYYLSDMQPFDSLADDQGWGGVKWVGFERHESKHGVIVNPAFGGRMGSKRYALGKRVKVFKSGVAFTDDPHGHRLSLEQAVFVVLGDGKELWRSKPIGQNGKSEVCSVDVSGVSVLELRVIGGGLRFAAPAWLEPRVFADQTRAAAEPAMESGPPIKGQPPRSKESGREMREGVRQVDDLAVTTTRLEAAGILPCLCWSRDGKSFFYLDGPRGVLGQVDLATLKEVRRLEVGGKCSWLSVSSAGLLVSVTEWNQVWLVDPDGLTVKNRLAVPGLERAVSAPNLAFALARGTPLGFPGGAHLFSLDLATGTVAPAVIKGLDGKFLPAWKGPRMTADGKYLFTHHAELNRFRLEDRRLTFEESGPNIVGQGRLLGLEVSPDSRFVCLPAGGGNEVGGPFPGRKNLKPYSIYVYPVGDLKRPVIALEVGGYPTLVGFDPAARLIYSKNTDYQFIIFSETGAPRKQYRISDPTDDVRQFLPHPRGGPVLLLAKRLYVLRREGK